MNALTRTISVFAIATCVANSSAGDGKNLFLEHCASCHGPDGKGRTPAGKKLGAKDLTVSKISDAEIIRQILDGTKDSRGNARMPSFREKISAEEVPALVSFVKTLRKQPSPP